MSQEEFDMMNEGSKHRPILDFFKEKPSWESFISYLDNEQMVTFLGTLESLRDMANLEIKNRKYHPGQYHKSGSKLWPGCEM